jgi:hypothetical protein
MIILTAINNQIFIFNCQQNTNATGVDVLSRMYKGYSTTPNSALIVSNNDNYCFLTVESYIKVDYWH